MGRMRDALPADIAAQTRRPGGHWAPAPLPGGTWQQRSAAGGVTPGAPGAAPVAKQHSPCGAAHGASGASPKPRFPPRQGASPAAHGASGASPSIPPRAQQTGASPSVPPRSSAAGASPSFRPRAQGASPAASGPPARPAARPSGKAGEGPIRISRRDQRSANHKQAQATGTLVARDVSATGPARMGNGCSACQQRNQFSNRCQRRPQLCATCCKAGSTPCPCGDWSAPAEVNMCHK